MSNSGTNLQSCGRSRDPAASSPQLARAHKKGAPLGAPFGVGVSCSGYSSSPSSSHSLSLALAMLEAADS